jgi:hypothetical protein
MMAVVPSLWVWTGSGDGPTKMTTRKTNSQDAGKVGGEFHSRGRCLLVPFFPRVGGGNFRRVDPGWRARMTAVVRNTIFDR